jgi:cell wall assembly regulator SMI1
MQKFTRALTREIEVAGERLAVTLDEQGLTIRPVGARRPPHTMSWTACVCACVGQGDAPSDEQVQHALKSLRAGAPKTASQPESAGENTPVTPPGAGTAVPAGTPADSGRAEHAPTRSQPSASVPTPPPGGDASLRDLLARIDQWLKTHRPRFLHALQQGATPAECDALSTAVGAPIPDELRNWLSWHNGQNAAVPGALVENWHLMSTQQIADAKKDLDAENHAGWQHAWIPFLDDDNGNYLCLDPTRPGVAVRECWRGRAEHDVAAPSLAAWVQDFLRGLEGGAYTEDPERGTFIRS